MTHAEFVARRLLPGAYYHAVADKFDNIVDNVANVDNVADNVDKC